MPRWWGAWGSDTAREPSHQVRGQVENRDKCGSPAVLSARARRPHKLKEMEEKHTLSPTSRLETTRYRTDSGYRLTPKAASLAHSPKTCKHSVQILLPFILRGSYTAHTFTDSNDQRGRDALSSPSDKVTSRGGPRHHHGALFRGRRGRPDLGPSRADRVGAWVRNGGEGTRGARKGVQGQVRGTGSVGKANGEPGSGHGRREPGLKDL